MPQGFPDILEIVEKSRSGVKTSDNLKFSENYRRCQPHGCGKCGDRIPSPQQTGRRTFKGLCPLTPGFIAYSSGASLPVSFAGSVCWTRKRDDTGQYRPLGRQPALRSHPCVALSSDRWQLKFTVFSWRVQGS